ncbi:hypothetical protein LIER_38602 [Lithospermum erythrorhizon]|uniref:Pentatricopeptide repeat-containing protein n=1 Tax=Lithospermum erythrorhizon TaxID=34254 RepID=A0AAV3Q288_LITER
MSVSRSLEQHLFSLLQPNITLKQTSQIHTQIIKNGFTQKQFIIARLLSLYVTFKNLSLVTKSFNLIENPSTTIWNQFIRANKNAENHEKCVKFFCHVAQPDGYTYTYVISGCAEGGLVKEGEQIHGKVVKNGFSSNVFVQTSLVHFYSVFGGESGPVKQETSIWLEKFSLKNAVRGSFGCSSSRAGTSFSGLGESSVGPALKLFDEMSVRNVVTWNSLLSGYFMCGDVNEARRVFNVMPDRNVVSWTTMVAGLAKNGRSKEALSLFHEMWRECVEFDQVTLVAVLSACSELCDLRLGKWIHSYVIKSLIAGNVSILVSLNNALIHMYASCGAIREAYELFKKMPQRTTISWASIITGFAKQGYAEESLKVYYEMESSGGTDNRPDDITFLGVLSACSRAGYVDEGRRCFKLMSQDWDIEPKIEHYGCMVDLLSRAGLLDEARKLVETMPMKPNDAIWGTLLGGCRIHRNVELASHVAEKLNAELNPEKTAGYFLLLSDVYSTAKRWNEVVNLRRNMIEIGIRKPPSQSWIQ